MAMAILLIPVIYLTRAGIRAYLGADQAEALRVSAQR
jgi:hypothetical protein